MCGATALLRRAAHTPSALLLNANSRLQEPWFGSTGWLAHVWLTQVKRLGLRYVARVVQADKHYDVLTLHKLMKLPFRLQYFMEATDAKV
jgi:hypothetical protein